MARKKAIVAMSGGVDSSVAAALLVDAGYDVTGIMLKLWRGDEANHDSGCCNLGAAEDARRVADVLGIPFYVFNFADHFENTVISNFHADYAAGRTPNPCVRCNQWIKFGTLLERADQLGADILATGHYARVRESGGCFKLFRGVDPSKDQSYVLWMLTQDELARVRFPVGDMEKPQTRAMAEQLGLRTAHKPDSQEICFVRAGDLDGYVRENVPEASSPGAILDTEGNMVGEHKGVGRYTIGQRKGLGISLGHPVFVTSIDATANTLTVGTPEHLAVAGLTIDEVRFTDGPPVVAQVFVQHRAHGEVHPATLTYHGDKAEVVYDEPVRAVAPGQSAAFYSWADPDELLGGGVISVTRPVARATAGAHR